MSDIKNSLHSLHPYPCKFPAAVAERFIEPKGELLDPYCGSGTTLLEGALKGLNVFGFDCNPIARLISICKIREFTSKELSILKSLASDIANGKLQKNIGEEKLHEFEGKDHWFSTNAQNEFAVLLSKLKNFDPESSPWTLIATVISAITVTFSNQDGETRYAAVEKEQLRGDVIEAFGRKLSRAIIGLESRGSLTSKKRMVSLGDIRQGMPLPDNSISQVVTSPPYANTMDYYLYHKHRMNLLGFDFKVVQNHEIGSRHEFSSKKRDISVWNRDYLSGMQEVMRVLKPKGRAIFVIGDSQVAGQLIDGAKLTLNCAKQLGLDAQVLESVPMTGKSRSFRASYQRPNKFEHIVEMRK